MSTALVVDVITKVVMRRKELARRYGVTERTIDRMRREGRLPKPIYIHGPVWRAFDIARWEEEGSV